MKKVDSDRRITPACIQVIIHTNIISISNDFIFKLSINIYLQTMLVDKKLFSNHCLLRSVNKEIEEEKKKGEKKGKKNIRSDSIE